MGYEGLLNFVFALRTHDRAGFVKFITLSKPQVLQ